MYPHRLHDHREIPDLVCKRLRQPKQVVEIIFLKEELVHDIETDTHKIEKARKIDDLNIATDEHDRYEVCRQIDRGINKATGKMAAYLLMPSPWLHRITNNHIKDWQEKSIYLALPHNWPGHHIDQLRDTIHDYVVKSAEAELLSPLLTPSDPYVQYLIRSAEDRLIEINSIISARFGPIDITPSPFG